LVVIDPGEHEHVLWYDLSEDRPGPRRVALNTLSYEASS
jgi:hypothetical protein